MGEKLEVETAQLGLGWKHGGFMAGPGEQSKETTETFV
jgi:hypothetical protein